VRLSIVSRVFYPKPALTLALTYCGEACFVGISSPDPNPNPDPNPIPARRRSSSDVQGKAEVGSYGTRASVDCRITANGGVDLRALCAKAHHPDKVSCRGFAVPCGSTRCALCTSDDVLILNSLGVLLRSCADVERFSYFKLYLITHTL